ncbi:NUDIX domain-containing protein [Caldibacillus lycopersici]|uniref:NUDIX domain-containing protein n=1 Tax=Perspicuibacillus lycopersici TaxID=1325689 RepID=A0AAE3ITV9_9BACI|nr:NUDIX domain-containing protein [Perspicuibacillus lycopersici]MCU9612030.1 NUDIX domain-containing protein [Perspicuibacillus lycopersici]
MEQKIIVVLKGVIIHNGKVLIVQRADHDETGAGTWETVGGKLEFGENLEAALIREIQEEANINVRVEKLLYATTFLTNSMRQVVILTYLCTSNQSTIQLSSEHQNYKWANKEELLKKLPPEMIADFEKHHVIDQIV